MGVHEGTQKVLVGANDYIVVVAGLTDRFWWRYGYRAFYLYNILSMAVKGKKTEPVKTILIIVLGFTFVYWLTKSPVWLGIAFFTGLAGFLSRTLAEKIDWCWMKLAWLLGLIVPNILLSLVFYLFLTPLGLLSRLGGKDHLSLKNTRDSLFKETNKQYSKESFEKVF